MEIFYNTDLTGRNTFRMRVRAACLVEYDSVSQLRALFEDERTAGEFPLPFFHIGGGSNLLFTEDFPGTLLHSRIRFIESEREGHNVLVRVGSGALWDDFCLWCSERRLWGAENLSLIPGEVGAAAVQNIGAYGREVSDIIQSVECYDIQERQMKILLRNECGYGYRNSIFKGECKGRYVVTAVIFKLTEDYTPCLDYGGVRQAVTESKGRYVVDEGRLDPSDVRAVIVKIRKGKLPDPKDIGSAGSFFRNPFVLPEQYTAVAQTAEKEGLGEVPHFLSDGLVKIPAAWLIEKCGWKGYIGDNAGIYSKQPLVIINASGNASPSDILELEDRVVASVRQKFGIVLQPEVEHV